MAACFPARRFYFDPQKHIFVPIDIFLKNKENRNIRNWLNAWLLFLGSDDPEDIIRLIELHPDFKAMYRQKAEITRQRELLAEKDRALAKQREECEAALLRIAQMERDMERRSL